MKLDHITETSILEAFTSFETKPYDPARGNNTYEVTYLGKNYPPKVVISRAESFVNPTGREKPADDFNGGRGNANDFLLERGFPIVKKYNPANEIIKEDCDFIDMVASKPYDKSNPVHRNQANFFKNVICYKNRLWAEKIKEKNKDYRFDGIAIWNQQSNKRDTNQQFRYFTWYRIHHVNNDSDVVFFTVGFEGPRAGGIQRTKPYVKLDCRKSKLSDQKVKQFKSFLLENKVEELAIEFPPSGLIKWDDLVHVSLEYMERHMEIYNKAIDLIASQGEEMVSRIVWNTNSWIAPSGRVGKSHTKAESHEKDYGYGHEEWLFDTSKIVDGYCYGRLESLHTPKNKHAGKTYNITLYTHDGVAKRWYWVGKILNVEAIDAATSEDISRIYRSNYWLDEQVEQLRSFENVDADSYRNWDDKDKFNCRFKPADIILYNLQPFKENEKVPSGHYTLPELQEKPAFLLEEKGDDDESLDGIIYGNTQKKNRKETSIRTYKPEPREIPNLHDKLQDAFFEYLKKHYPQSKVYLESRKLINNTCIDIHQVLRDGTVIFYEVKTYPSVMQSIRVAIGQLLEYCCYATQMLANKCVIVSHQSPLPKDWEYLDFIADKLPFAIEYICFDLEKNEINPRLSKNEK